MKYSAILLFMLAAASIAALVYGSLPRFGGCASVVWLSIR
jgi:hypothetical protein